jgi:hypothetical protein
MQARNPRNPSAGGGPRIKPSGNTDRPLAGRHFFLEAESCGIGGKLSCRTKNKGINYSDEEIACHLSRLGGGYTQIWVEHNLAPPLLRATRDRHHRTGRLSK